MNETMELGIVLLSCHITDVSLSEAHYVGWRWINNAKNEKRGSTGSHRIAIALPHHPVPSLVTGLYLVGLYLVCLYVVGLRLVPCDSRFPNPPNSLPLREPVITGTVVPCTLYCTFASEGTFCCPIIINILLIMSRSELRTTNTVRWGTGY